MTISKFILALSFLFILISSNAQEERETSKKAISSFEIIGGSGITRNAGNYSDIDSKFAYDLGVGITHSFRRYFEIKMKILWDRKGSKVNTKIHEVTINNYSTTYSVQYNNTFNYITFPVRLNLLKPGPKWKVIIGAGGYFSFLGPMNLQIHKVDLMTNYSTTHTIKEYRKSIHPKYDAGFSVATGYRIPINGKNDCSVQIIFNKGLTYVEDGLNEFQRNNVFQLEFSYNFLN